MGYSAAEQGVAPGDGTSRSRLLEQRSGYTGLRPTRARLLAETADRLERGDDPDEVVLPALYRGLAEERIADASLGFIVTELGEGIKLAYADGFEPSVVQKCLTLDFGQAICGTVAATRLAMQVSDVQRTFNPLADLIRSAGIHAYACEPLLAEDGTLLGTLSFGSRSRRSFDSEDLLFFRAVARQVARARSRSRYRPRTTTRTRPRSRPAKATAPARM